MPTKQGIPTCFASVSIGHRPEHNLPGKLTAISNAGFDAIELGMPDLLSFAGHKLGRQIDPKDFDSLCTVGQEVKKLCEEKRLRILILQPFSNFEGWPRGSREREDAFERAKGWMRVMEAVGTDMLQVGSSDSPNISSSFDDLASDVRELADMLAKKSFRIAYENWCWATYAPGWREVWNIVQRVDRPNVGLCLDTFQSGGGEWADPTTVSGRVEGLLQSGLDESWKRSCEELAKTIPPEKIFFLQISDAYKMDPPLHKEPYEDGLRPRGYWSHAYRPLPYDGGYLPVVDFTKAVLRTGFTGWMSIEVFDEREEEKYRGDIGICAAKAHRSLERLLEEAGA